MTIKKVKTLRSEIKAPAVSGIKTPLTAGYIKFRNFQKLPVDIEMTMMYT